MPAMDDDDRPKKKIVHEIGQELTLLSVAELQERIGCCVRRSRGWKPISRRSRPRARRPTSSSRNRIYASWRARAQRQFEPLTNN